MGRPAERPALAVVPARGGSKGLPGKNLMPLAGRSLLEPANTAFVHSMHITTLVAALLALAGGFVVLRWMPGRPRPVTEQVTGPVTEPVAAAVPALAGDDRSYEAELAILEEQHMLEGSEREG